jgi:ActR/RegA family two-component response regulator
MQTKHPNCANIVLTAYPAVESAIEGIRLHIDDYIVKPANANALVAVLAERLRQRSAKPNQPLAADA